MCKIPIFDIGLDKVRITIIYPNAQVKEIEDAVCIKVEEALQDIAEITVPI